MEHEHDEENGHMVIENNNAFLMAMGEGSRIEIHAADADKVSHTQITQTADAGSTELHLEDATGWEVGDRIAISSTDYNPNEAEERTIVAIRADGTIVLDEPLVHRHNGTVEDYSNGQQDWDLDMRAEVALLSRNVTIQGDEDSVQDGYGGHSMVMHGAEQHISGAEFFRMGQEGELGRYPVHWHELRDGGEGQYIENSSVHASYNKGVTIHDTNFIYAQNNVVFNTVGHGYFFEDGSETDNVLIGNIAFGQHRAGSLAEATIASDFGRVTSYWVTNPTNHFIDNVAAGSEGSGFWLTAEPVVTGSAGATGDYDGYVPMEQSLGLIDGFVSHSNAVHNFAMGWRINEDTGRNQAGFFIEEHNENGALVTGTISDLTLYKSSGDGSLWLRGFGLEVEDSVLADSQNQVMFRGWSALSDSLLVARTDNESGGGVRDGIQLYDEGNSFENLHFVGYNQANDDAFYQRRGVDIGLHTATNITFEDTTDNALYSNRGINNANIDGRDWNASIFVDVDGSVFGEAGRVITPVIDQSGSPVVSSEGWNAAPGATLYQGDAWFNPVGTVFANVTIGGERHLTITRSDGPTFRHNNNDREHQEFIAIADQAIVYSVAVDATTGYDSPVTLGIEYVPAGSEVLFRLPTLPEEATLQGAAEVATMAELEASDLSVYMKEDTGILIKIVGVDQHEEAPNTPEGYNTSNYGNLITITPDGSVAPSADTPWDGVDRSAVDADPIDVPDFVEDDSETTVVTDTMARWSDASTWGDAGEPGMDDIVVIGPGQTVVLDDTVLVKGIIVDGGELIVEDDANLVVDVFTDYLLVTNGGLFQAGTEDNPLDTDFTLTLEGDDPDFDLHVTTILNGEHPNTVFADTGMHHDEPELIGQSGSVTVEQANANQWHSVSFDHAMEDAVVVMAPVSFNGGHEAHARVRNVTDTGFEFQIEEWEHRDGYHTTETISWLAVEAGTHTLEDGSVIQAGASGVGDQATQIAFSEMFDEGPVVMGQVASEIDGSAVTDRIFDVEEDGFSVLLQEQERDRATGHDVEDFHWIAFETGAHAAFSTNIDAADHTAATVDLNGGYDGVLLADMQTFAGSDTASVRFINQSDTSATVFIQEERSRDSEVRHVFDDIGFVQTDEFLFA